MRYMVVIEKVSPSYGAFVPDLPGCIAVAETEAETLALIKEAIQFHLADMIGRFCFEPDISQAGYIALWIEGGKPHISKIDPHNNHRLARSSAFAGLITTGTLIENESCVEKSFPEFLKVFESLYP